MLNIYHIEPMDCEHDWHTLQTVTSHIKTKLQNLNIDNYAVALQARDMMRSALGTDRYSLNDLVTFVCLVTV